MWLLSLVMKTHLFLVNAFFSKLWSCTISVNSWAVESCWIKVHLTWRMILYVFHQPEFPEIRAVNLWEKNGEKNSYDLAMSPWVLATNLVGKMTWLISCVNTQFGDMSKINSNDCWGSAVEKGSASVSWVTWNQWTTKGHFIANPNDARWRVNHSKLLYPSISHMGNLWHPRIVRHSTMKEAHACHCAQGYPPQSRFKGTR